MTHRKRACWIAATALTVVAAPVSAQTIPFADTEDATLSAIDVRDGARDWHPVVSLDLRNGDYARGAIDDDDYMLDRVPVHIALGGAVTVRRRADGRGDLFVIAQSSNGFHAPRADERASPRAWYESNNLVGVAWRPREELTVATTYAIKASPNGIAETTHEASLSALYTARKGWGRLKPRLSVTRRTQGDGGVYTIAGIAPSFDLSERDDGPTVSIPVMAGVGWHGFYGPGTGDRAYASGGVTLAQPVEIGDSEATLQTDLLALVRDDGLRRLDAPDGPTATVIPHAMLSLVMAW